MLSGIRKKFDDTFKRQKILGNHFFRRGFSPSVGLQSAILSVIWKDGWPCITRFFSFLSTNPCQLVKRLFAPIL